MKKDSEEKIITMVVRIPKYKKEMIRELAKKQNRYESEIIRSGIDKELRLELYHDNLEKIIGKVLKPVDEKLNKFLRSQRKLNAKFLRTTAINTYLNGEILSGLLGDDFNELFKRMLKNARRKANFYINKDTTGMSQLDLYDFYNIGELYRDEYRNE